MPEDLLSTAHRDYIRISESGHCRLNIAYTMLGEKEVIKNSSVIAMDMGSALEPVINKQLRAWGLGVAFDGAYQLEVALQDPYRRGHPDGLVWCPNPTLLDPFFISICPSDLLEALFDGELMLLEDKTMNDASWRKFNRNGLVGDRLFEDYILQINSYLEALHNPQHDELWVGYDTQYDIHGNPNIGPDGAVVPRYQFGVDEYKAFLADERLARPTRAMVVGFNTASKKFAFEMRTLDTTKVADISASLSTIPEAMHNGEMPPPDYDGKHASCFWCRFKAKCPAVQHIYEMEDIGAVDVTAPGALANESEAIALSEEYARLNRQKKDAEDRLKDIKEEMVGLVGSQFKSVLGNYRVSLSPTTGRKALDMAMLERYAKVYGFEIPYKDGAPSTRLSITQIIGAKATTAAEEDQTTGMEIAEE